MSTSLVQAQAYMSLYGLSTFYVFGTVGNILLISILVQSTHRRNSCSLYLLSATIVNFILIQCILPVGAYAGNHPDPQNVSLIWCKIRSYLFNALLMLYRWFKMAACADRAAMCNRRAWIRSFSTARVAYRVILGITIVWLLIPIHLGVYFENQTGHCIPRPGAYAKFFSAYSILISGWSPPTVMLIFGIIAYRNLRQIRAQVVPADAGPNHRRIGNRDQQLILLLICEVLVYVTTNLLYSINITYQAITTDVPKNAERNRIESFISYFSTPFLIIINNCIPFYLYLMVSSKFRRDTRDLFITIYRCHRPTRQQMAITVRTKLAASTAAAAPAQSSRVP